MRYRYIRIIFPEPLTGDQEEILNANLLSIKEGIVYKLNQLLAEVEHGWAFKGYRALPMGHATTTLMTNAITHALFNFQMYIFQKKEADNIVAFYFARDELALIKFRQHRLIDTIDDTRVCDGLKIFVFPEMKVDPEKVQLEMGWVEKV